MADDDAPATEGVAIVFALAAPTNQPAGVGYEIHRIGSTDCVLAYTTRQRLVECCGEHQPWAAVDFAKLVADVHAHGLAGPVLDAPLSVAARWTADGAAAGSSLAVRA